jgi:2-hydroxy-3-oxopropionate reductase
MTCIGFVGLGIMGSPMAAHLVAAGHDVTGFDLSSASVEKLVADGGKAALSAQEAVSGAEVVITMLPDHPQVEAVINEVTFDDGTLLIDMSTIRPSTSIEIARKLPDVRVLDAPVSGGQTGAQQASLSIMVGGEEADFAAARPFLEVVGRTIVHVGPHGAGQVVKAANQLMVGGIYALVAESIVLLEASGVDPKAGLDVLAGGLAANRILDLKRETMIAREFRPGFRIDLHHKDMGIALDAARAAGVALPVTNLIAALVAAGRAQGYGSLDHSALLKVIENFAGRA